MLTKACRAAVSMMAEGSIVARVLPLRCSYFYYQTIQIFQYVFLICTI